jgi:Leucine-rich repeat (LRR) protein
MTCRLAASVVVGMGMLARGLWAEDCVRFQDANPKAAVELALGRINPTAADMQNLKSLNGGSRGVVSLSGLEYVTRTTWLNLSHNQTGDIAPLVNLTKLAYLRVRGNRISDPAPLSGLMDLVSLRS